MAIFPLFYAGNIAYYRRLIASDQVQFEVCEHFPKQTYRNRMEILGPNGLQKLVIPTIKTGDRRPMGEVKISYAERWQKEHWKSLEAAYRRSPYFEFYEDRFQVFYTDQVESLVQFNIKLHETICSLLELDISYELTSSYDPSSDPDFRSSSFNEIDKEVEYMQVFSDRHPFHANLSILDALFNLGPQARTLLA